MSRNHLTLVPSPKAGGYTLNLMCAVASSYFDASPARVLEFEGIPGAKLTAVTIQVAVEQTTPDWAQARVIQWLRRDPAMRRESVKRHAMRHTPGRLFAQPQPEPPSRFRRERPYPRKRWAA